MNKTALITGASKGIGSACAVAFAMDGYNVVINYNYSGNSAASLKNTINSNGYNSIAVAADVRSFEEVDRMVEYTIKQFGSIDVLVNNAGIAQQKPFTDITIEDWNNMIETDLTGVFNCCKSVIPHMIKRKCGSIINISSMWGETGGSCEVHYSAAKAGVIGLTKALAKEMGPSNIRVNCVSPGVINTDMNKNLSLDDMNSLCDETPLGRIGTPDEVAKTVLFLANEDSSFITGQVISPNGGIYI